MNGEGVYTVALHPVSSAADSLYQEGSKSQILLDAPSPTSGSMSLLQDRQRGRTSSELTSTVTGNASFASRLLMERGVLRSDGLAGWEDRMSSLGLNGNRTSNGMSDFGTRTGGIERTRTSSQQAETSLTYLPHEIFRQELTNGGWGGNDMTGSSPGSARSSRRSHRSRVEVDEHAQIRKRSSGESSMWVAWHPDSIGMMFWEALGLLAMLWDCFAVPWFLAFYAYPEDTSIFYATFYSRLYWTFDAPVKLHTAFYTPEHRLERNLRKVGMRYLRRMLILDLILIAADWTFAWFAWPGSYSGSSVPRAVKALLGMLVLRFVRHIKRLTSVNEKFHLLAWQNGQNGMGMSFVISKTFIILFFLLMFNHVVSCTWYAIGHIDDEALHDTWLTSYIEQSLQHDRGYLYFTALHWALTQFLPGSMEVFPTKFNERVFNVSVLILGWVVIVTSTALLTSVMTQQRLRVEQKQLRRMRLQKYLSQERIEHSLAMSIKRNVRARSMEKVLMKVGDVEDLAFVSTSLRKELAFTVYGAKLRWNSFFSVMEAFDFQAYLNICNGSITNVYLRADELAFEEGTAGDSMSFVNHGSLLYNPGRTAQESSLDPADSKLSFFVGASYGEPAMWCEWRYLGTMASCESTELLRISANTLVTQLRKRPEALAFTLEFCTLVAQAYQAIGSLNRSWSDISLPLDHADIVGSMPRETRIRLGEAMLALLHQKEQWGFVRKVFNDSNLTKLSEEIHNGSSFVSRHGDEFFRTVFIVALRLRRSSDPSTFLARIGEVTNDGKVLKAACQLPGTKRKEQEAALAAIQRFLKQELPEQEPHVTLNQGDQEHSATTEESAKYGIRSRYLKTTFDGVVNEAVAFMTRPSFPINLDMSRGLKRSTRGSATPRRDFLHPSSRSASCTSGAARGFSWLLYLLRRHSSGSNVARAKVEAPHTSSAVLDILHSLQEHVLIPTRRGKEIYIWVTDADFQALQSPKASSYLLSYLKEFAAWEICPMDSSDAPPSTTVSASVVGWMNSNLSGNDKPREEPQEEQQPEPDGNIQSSVSLKSDEHELR
eukprot:CAMPEP_0178459118 /NCGR_PEP_ID=MMETSP0689_2-20121128/47938_1 /TAXON_ID=160604 /ORGANISM="Amphidinium massartii, Strain CS-259" /LENGTH=1054 /DNA_ID=CAMNT_0020085531 /DNA_START=32 /DNA_END=3194 /DNA_ORIENTATION=-